MPSGPPSLTSSVITSCDLSINDYTAKLKELADALRDLGQPVPEPS